mmetsp:Transcript_5641/g.11248  ORF Transcript_5641/g.11248 Transcript_5641/m.11248 type:complete len:639 (-) Transcript_5641:116-2032(-)
MAGSTQKILHVAGYSSCGFYARTLQVLRSIAVLFPHRFQVVNHELPDRTAFRAWLVDGGFRQKFSDSATAQTHATCPFCWLGKSNGSGSNAASTDLQSLTDEDIGAYIGGHDATLDWCRTLLTPGEDEDDDMDVEDGPMPDGHVANHPYEYDLVVIGGGSGGMAASKEAAALGARVACCDFVKPSPLGTSWGLGGTCVNVGCIPKKLFHAGSLLAEAVRHDTAAYGLQVGDAAYANGDGPTTKTQWDQLRDNIQNHIRSLNFKYRVRLREKEVTYLNKLATFQDAHTITVVDKKGRESTITSSRFLIATGGRPSPLDCEGGELAISSDDIFSLDREPGKTLCVGASYISLECAGFLHGLNYDTTVAVRSILLRGFDRECADKIGAYMKDQGIKFKEKVVPTKLSKTESGQIQVVFSDGSSDVYDTVLVAIGRQADTAKLGLDKVGVPVNPKSLRILPHNKWEQTACPNIYAIGDVLDGTPELTPVAIQAGLLLANRLFGASKEPMDYVNVCTTVFTPLEYSCVGLSEDDAIAKYGEAGIEVYHREFVPLEWSLSPARSHHSAFTKIIVDKTPQQNVLGIHYVGPNAGEVMQGYGVAIKQGLTYEKLTSTVGIHPTNAEEIVTLTITKSSGEDAAAGGC